MVKKKDQLEPLDLDPWRVMAIVAHPDDMEYGPAAAVAKWVTEGAEVIYLIASRGEAGMADVEPEQAALIRSAEQAASASLVGVDYVDFLDVHDGIIEHNVELRRKMVTDIRRFRPDIVLLMNHRETWAPGMLNSADHRNVGNAALDAIADAGNQWVFRERGKAHKVDIALVAGSPDATHGIDVTGFEAKAVASLAAHKQYLESLGDHPMADPKWVANQLKETAKRLPGSKAAIAVEVFRFT
jgi:LmbE family N-acetylglucosaminyl deacetylase